MALFPLPTLHRQSTAKGMFVSWPRRVTAAAALAVTLVACGGTDTSTITTEGAPQVSTSIAAQHVASTSTPTSTSTSTSTATSTPTATTFVAAVTETVRVGRARSDGDMLILEDVDVAGDAVIPVVAVAEDTGVVLRSRPLTGQPAVLGQHDHIELRILPLGDIVGEGEEEWVVVFYRDRDNDGQLGEADEPVVEGGGPVTFPLEYHP